MLRNGIVATSLACALFAVPAFGKGYKEITVKNGSVIRGTVTYGKPQPAVIAAGQPECGPTVDNPNITVINGRLANAVILLKGVKKGKAFLESQKNVLSDQKKCVFKPHIAMVAEGGSITFRNSDPAMHNVKVSNPTMRLNFNEGLAKQGDTMTKSFPKAGKTVMACAAHSFMKAHIVVMDNPYYAVTDGNGQFVINDVPPGKYKIEVWHGDLGLDAQISLEGSEKSQSAAGTSIKVGKNDDIIFNASYGGGTLKDLTPPDPAKFATGETTPAPKTDRKPEPKTEPKAEPKTEPKAEPKVKKEPKTVKKPKKPAPAPEPAPVTTPAPAPTVVQVATPAPVTTGAAQEGHGKKLDGKGVKPFADRSALPKLLILLIILGGLVTPAIGYFGIHDSPLRAMICKATEKIPFLKKKS